MPAIGVGQYHPDLIAFCKDCKANVRAYYVTKDRVVVCAICPVKGHNQPCVVGKPLEWEGGL